MFCNKIKLESLKKTISFKIKLESWKKNISFKIEMNRVSKDVSKEVLDIYVYKVSVLWKLKIRSTPFNLFVSTKNYFSHCKKKTFLFQFSLISGPF